MAPADVAAIDSSATPPWRLGGGGGGEWVYAYQPTPPAAVRLTRTASRTAWGSAQEATGALVVLNEALNGALASPGTNPPRLCEVGLCPLEAVLLVPGAADQLAAAGVPLGRLPPLGASPDGVLVHADGRVEAVEVKVSAYASGRRFLGGRELVPGAPF